MAWLAGLEFASSEPAESAWFQPPPLHQWQLSPDGQHVGALDLKDGSWLRWSPGLRFSTPAVETTPGPFAEFGWSGSGAAILRDGSPNGFPRWWLAGETNLVPFDPFLGEVWLRLLRPAPMLHSGALIEGFPRTGAGRRETGRWLNVLQISGPNTPARIRAANPGDVVEWLADGTGRVRLALGIRGEHQELRVARASGGGADWQTVHTFDFLHDPARLLGMSADGQRAWLAARLGRDTRGVYEFDVPGRRIRRAVWTDPEFDFDGTLVVTGNDLAALTYEAVRPVSVWIQPEWQRTRMGQDGWLVLGVSLDGAFGLFQEIFAGSEGKVGWFDRHREVLREISKPAPFRTEKTGTFPLHAVEWAARDGVKIRGYFTAPVSAGSRPPLVVLVHGGPWTRDTWGWPPEAPFLASRGWAVLQVNYRGSAGLGRAFQELGAGQWRQAVEDLEDGARWAAEQCLVEDRRWVVAGASFGGFLSALAVTQPDTPFQAAVSLGGVFDLVRWLDETRRREPEYVWRAQEAWLLGSGRPDRKSIRVNADQVIRPLLLVHTRDDERVNFAHSARFAEALRQRGRRYEFEARERGGHGLGTPEDQAEIWDRVERFLTRMTTQRE